MTSQRDKSKHAHAGEGSIAKEEKRVLLVDDDKMLVESFKSILEGEGYIVEKAMTGQQALERASKQCFDLAIMDIVLPDIRGDKVAIKLKKQNEKMGLIFITGYPSFQSCIDALNIGVTEILLKPISPAELLCSTRKALSKVET